MRKRILVACLLSAAVLGARHYAADVDTHRRFDGVLYPEFQARMNDWVIGHPLNPGHEQTVNAGDVKRWQAARAAWRELDDAAKALGY